MHWQLATDTILSTLIQQPRLGLVTDVDGTISPIVAQPDAARVLPDIQTLLRQMVPLFTLVGVISGRGAEDVAQRVGVTGVTYIGNHGLEHWRAGQAEIAPAAAAYRPALVQASQQLQPDMPDGMWIEDKGATLSIHYRQTADPSAVKATFTRRLEQLADALDLHFFEGRLIFELRPPVAVNKGTALQNLVDQHQLNGVIYLGDDVTDVDAIQTAVDLRRQGVYGVGVGVVADSETPPAVAAAADLTANGVTDVAALFAWLLKARKPSFT